MSAQIPIPALIPLPLDQQTRANDDKDDLFATLFSPPTPRASPTLPPTFAFVSAADTRSQPIHRARTQSVDSDFGAFVSVPSSEDPLHASSSPADFSPFTPMQNIEFLGSVADSAIQATARNKQGVLDELLQHEDDPLYFLQVDPGPSASTSASASRTSTPMRASDPEAPPSDSQPSSTSQPLQPPPISSLTSAESARPSRDTVSTPSAPPSRGRSASPPLRSLPLLAPSFPLRISQPAIQPAQSFFTPSSFPSRWVSSFLSSAARSPPRRAATEADPSSAPSSSSLRHYATLPPTLPDGIARAQTVRVAGAAAGADGITHGTPFAAHPFVPATGAPGFAGDHEWDKGFEFEGATDAKSVRLVGRKELTVPLLTVQLADLLRPHFPALARLPRVWTLLYSLDQHGISLNTLYTRCDAHTGGALVVLRDARNAVFGAWMGEGIRLSKGTYFGSGESFLWRLMPDDRLRIYKWTGKNDYIALCEADYMSFGGGDGHYGLYIDSSLTDGSSARCPTFNNEPLCSAGPRQGDSVLFECVGLEVWGVG